MDSTVIARQVQQNNQNYKIKWFGEHFELTHGMIVLCRSETSKSAFGGYDILLNHDTPPLLRVKHHSNPMTPRSLILIT